MKLLLTNGETVELKVTAPLLGYHAKEVIFNWKDIESLLKLPDSVLREYLMALSLKL